MLAGDDLQYMEIAGVGIYLNGEVLCRMSNQLTGKRHLSANRDSKIDIGRSGYCDPVQERKFLRHYVTIYGG